MYIQSNLVYILTWRPVFEHKDQSATSVSPFAEGTRICISAPYDSHKQLQLITDTAAANSSAYDSYDIQHAMYW